ncbi:MAG: hypothetical protein Rubg2KO_36890 [Rubricoccaceae bacterium]
MADADLPPEDAPKSGKKGFLMPIAAALLIGVGGAAAVAKADTIKAAVGLSDGTDVAVADTVEAPPPAEFGEFMELPSFVVNPRNSDGRRFFMARVGIEAEDAKTLERMDVLSPAITDAMVGMMSKLTVEEINDIARRDSLKDALRTSFNQMLGEDGPISRVYFTQYVLQ